ncbi:hypothetical protein F442_21538 [Phytophthora nicotianae P10297]|uniref:Uncharacterized protein n=1 Tax=Phytophthora nicotianae P10297 TaxID=1317064 RepID=W2Y2G6_PHYNI|nr:hypothetical protein F442_21538 [Phytophthora nicotianae P10297]
MVSATSSKWTVSAAQLAKLKEKISPPVSEVYAKVDPTPALLKVHISQAEVKKNTNKADRVKLRTAYDDNKEGVVLLLEVQDSKTRKVSGEERRHTKNLWCSNYHGNSSY